MHFSLVLVVEAALVPDLPEIMPYHNQIWIIDTINFNSACVSTSFGGRR